MTRVPARAFLLVLALTLSACAGAEPAARESAPADSASMAHAPASRAVGTVTILARTTLLTPGDTVLLLATPRDAGETALPGREVTWTSDSSRIATVSSVGLVTAVGAGTATISAASEGISETVPITVRPRASITVRLAPGDDIQARVDSHPPGTTFRLAAGVYRRQSVAPKDGMSFVGDSGATLDGEGAVPYAFRADTDPLPRNVTIRGLIIERYDPPVQDGAIKLDGASAGGWVIEGCEIRLNTTGGIRLGNRARVLRNRIHHNGQIGILGGGDDILIEGNEIAYNNPRARYDMYWEAGGTKFARTRDLVVRSNFVHHNHGPGLWTDIDNVRTLYERNRVEDNAEAGIFHEISYSAVIRENTARRNGTHAVPADGVTGAGILVSVSQHVEVYGNTVEDNRNGVVGIQAGDRGSGAYGAYALRGLDVHDNTISMPRGVSGIATTGSAKLFDRATYTTRDNRFRANSYSLATNSRPFTWLGARRTEREWRALGQDVTGEFRR